ncbi:hypothetical protein LIP_0946 [Limnochorda pilosa]|uniref:Uncharacterized protein n=1 Tax=Limnochorda pilosa TaxID=1555112 RepID=A0A0K2SI72_LIMPI|nr:hypothetical protein LIP_0946 [Limnochorda pilosa]
MGGRQARRLIGKRLCALGPAALAAVPAIRHERRACHGAVETGGSRGVPGEIERETVLAGPQLPASGGDRSTAR